MYYRCKIFHKKNHVWGGKGRSKTKVIHYKKAKFLWLKSAKNILHEKFGASPYKEIVHGIS